MEYILFRDGDDWENNSILRRHSSNQWMFYVEGYRIAAEKLIENVLTTQTERDTLIYPIVFLYRHYIEIQLKEIIQTGSEYLGKKKKQVKGHILYPLWLEAKNIIDEIWIADTNNVNINQTEEIIKAICAIDTKSDAFRYPIDIKGKQTLTGITVVNLRELKESISPAIQFLDGVALGISALQDKKDEGKAD